MLGAFIDKLTRAVEVALGPAEVDLPEPDAEELTPEIFARLVEEGAQIRRAFEQAAGCTQGPPGPEDYARQARLEHQAKERCITCGARFSSFNQRAIASGGGFACEICAAGIP